MTDDDTSADLDFGNDATDELDQIETGDADPADEGPGADPADEGPGSEAADEGADDDTSAADDDAGGKKDDNLIPRPRFNEAVQKERAARQAAETRARELEAKLLEGQTHQVEQTHLEEVLRAQKAAEDAYTKALEDGAPSDEAARLFRVMRDVDAYRARAEAQFIAREQSMGLIEAARLDEVVTTIETTYPAFDQNSDAYDEMLTKLVSAEYETRLNQGIAPSRAMRQAADAVAGRFLKGASGASGAAAGKTKAEDTDTESKGAKTASARKKEAIARNVATANRQPPTQAGVGANSDAAGRRAGAAVSEADLDKLTADELEEALGNA
ncbi:MAG: hypothetical protein LBC97_15840 [Bifidobacteriaceae bacterium]|jgi:hypothetical protein|nr:hypothetical protein [Bifidobacteriaceae bacterium]